MSEESNKNFQNATAVIDAKTVPVGFNWFYTLLFFLCVVCSVIVFFTTIYFMVRKKRLGRELRNRLVPLYHFDPAECEDWEEELTEELIDGKFRKNFYYRSMSLQEVAAKY